MNASEYRQVKHCFPGPFLLQQAFAKGFHLSYSVTNFTKCDKQNQQKEEMCNSGCKVPSSPVRRFGNNTSLEMSWMKAVVRLAMYSQDVA